MNRRPKLAIVFFLIAAFGLVLNANSQNAAAPQNKDSQVAASELRELYFARDYESGFERGRRYAARFPENFELRAWFILNEARNEMTAEAVKDAKTLVETNKESAWAWFALANAYIRDSQSKEGLDAAERAVALAPENEEFVFLYNSALLANQKYDEIYAFLDKNSAKVKDRARFLYTRAEAQYRQAIGGTVPNDALKKTSFENFAEALKLNPNGVGANYIYAVYLNGEKRFAEALPLLKKAVSLSPDSSSIRRQYWLAMLNGQPEKTEKQRTAEAVADTDNLLRRRPDSINALDTVSAFYESDLKMPEKRRELEAIIVKQFPASGKAEWIAVKNYREFAKNNDVYTDKAKKEIYKQMIRAFIERPQHVRENLLGDGYLALFLAVQNDSANTNDEMLKIVDGMVAYEKSNATVVYPEGAHVLADRKMFREAERIARLGLTAGRASVEKERSSYKEEKDYADALRYTESLMRDALGWVFFKENRLDDAEREWLEAAKINDKRAALLNHLGQLYEAKNDLERAENFYTKAYAAFYGKTNPYGDVLKNLYQKRNGNLTGFEIYFERVKTVERAARRGRILAERVKEPKSATPFTLKNLDAKAVSLADLKGKIVVVNIWGTWCGPCVGEMPEFQELHKKYQNDKDVAIITVNNDGDLKLVKKFMRDRKYDFTVLQDENYLQSVGVQIFPTTWFIDGDGKISFVKIGASDKLIEEFGWRIEALKKQTKSVVED